MFSLFFFVCLAGSKIATSQINNGTDGSLVPVTEPIVGVPRKCPPNEVLKSKVSCPPDTCDTLYLSFLCTADQIPSVVCTCKDSYLRTNSSSTGVCVPADRCLPPECADDPNAQRGCGNRCKKTCADYNDARKVCENNVCNLFGCDCKDGFIFDESIKKCVKPEQCTAINCTRKNEVYNSCPSDCLAENCEDADTVPAVCNTLLLNCQPKCICKKGYYRNKDGLCIPAKECPTKCGLNEEYYCGTSCPEASCNDPEPPICINKKCKLACFCKKGFVRDANNKCIPLNTCPSVCKDPNSQWKNCTDLCPGTCQNTRPVCLISSDCTPGCQCNEGFVLSKPDGKCVNIEDCADYAECGANQTFVSCTFRCPQVMCPESDLTILCKPPRDCPGGCGCKPNYRYNADEECILGSECPPVECTRENEEWAPCRSDYDWERCEDRFNTPPIVPADHEYCNPRCTCKKGYYKINYDECVPESECPPIP